MALKASVATRDLRPDGRRIAFLERTPDHVFASWRNVMVAYWVNRTTPAAVVRLSGALERLHDEARAPLRLIQIVSQKAPAPDNETRSALQSMLHGRGDIIAFSSVVSPGSGFRAASVRALITGLVMLARPKFPHVIHATFEETARWHADQMQSESGPTRPDEFLGVIRSVCVTAH